MTDKKPQSWNAPQKLDRLLEVHFIVIGFLIVSLLYIYVIYPFSPSVTALITITLLVWFVVFIGVAFSIIGIEKLYIHKFFNDIPKSQEEINIL